jgi:hypothetical protein
MVYRTHDVVGQAPSVRESDRTFWENFFQVGGQTGNEDSKPHNTKPWWKNLFSVSISQPKPDTETKIVQTVRPKANDPFLATAKAAVEQSIDILIDEFVRAPYLHRVEHSVHAMLYDILKQQKALQGEYRMKDGSVTQLVHKEWPETKPRPEKGNKRGNFDIAILTPSLIEACSGAEMFQNGRINAPIVMELGLNYDQRHLSDDKYKLINSSAEYPQGEFFGYLVHLVRNNTREPGAEAIIEDNNPSFIKSAYAYVSDYESLCKKVNERRIH